MLPFTTYVWKIASRCNLNCSYCFVYNLGDTSWRSQPSLMSETVATTAAKRALEHSLRHRLEQVQIILHGGEPMMGGLSHLRIVVGAIERVFANSGINLGIAMQTNLLLFSREIGDFLLERKVTLGVSLDGPPEVNDVYRVDHRGRGSSAQLEEKLALLTSEYRPVFRGFLCVVDPITDPIGVTDYLLSFSPPVIDYLLPLKNHDNTPARSGADPVTAPFGRWLVRCYDHLRQNRTSTRIKFFLSIESRLCGRPSLVETVGVTPVTLAVIETNGDIEGLDSLKSSYEGATTLGFNVFDDDLEKVAEHAKVRLRQMGVGGLCASCQACNIVDVCGGGYIPHRYSAANGFDNPSVYCDDLKQLITHIHKSMRAELSARRLVAT